MMKGPVGFLEVKVGEGTGSTLVVSSMTLFQAARGVPGRQKLSGRNKRVSRGEFIL